MVTLDKNGAFHDVKGRYVSPKNLSNKELKEIHNNYTKDDSGRFHRPDGSFSNKKEIDKLREIKILTDMIEPPIPPSQIPEGFFSGTIENGNFVSKKWALYYQCKCIVDDDSPKYTDSVKIEDSKFLITHWLGISTWRNDFSIDDAINIHNSRWPDHKLQEIIPKNAKIKTEMRHL